MENKFRILRIIGTLWKVFAWVTLIGGVLFAIGVLLMGILGSGDMIFRQFGPRSDVMSGMVGVVSGIVGFVTAVIISVVYFLVLYAMGEFIDLLLAIEENTRQTTQLMRQEEPSEISSYSSG